MSLLGILSPPGSPVKVVRGSSAATLVRRLAAQRGYEPAHDRCEQLAGGALAVIERGRPLASYFPERRGN
jgi:hypothetical protein